MLYEILPRTVTAEFATLPTWTGALPGSAMMGSAGRMKVVQTVSINREERPCQVSSGSDRGGGETRQYYRQVGSSLSPPVF